MGYGDILISFSYTILRLDYRSGTYVKIGQRVVILHHNNEVILCRENESKSGTVETVLIVLLTTPLCAHVYVCV